MSLSIFIYNEGDEQLNTNINIIDVSIYYPENKVNKDYFIQKFDKQGIDIRGLLKCLGRDNIRIIKNNEETVITMAVNVGKRALKSANLNPEDIDMLIVTTDNPEYFAPSNALIINNKLGLVNANLTFDLNNNCISMLTAMDIATGIMKQRKEVKRAMIIGMQGISYFTREDDPVITPGGGDCAASIILEKEECVDISGVIDSVYLTNSRNQENMRLPGCGMSKVASGNVLTEDVKLRFIPHDVSYFSDEWTKMIKDILKRNNLSIKDVKHYLFSQFSLKDIKETLIKLGDDEEKYTFVSHKYGYTGCCSPIFALHEALEKGKVEKNSYVIFCSVGIGYSMAAILYKWL